MVLGGQTLRCVPGTASAAVFLIDMNTAFEAFVTARLTRYLTGKLTVLTQDTRPFGHSGTARIGPDLIFESPPGKTVYVANTKYKIAVDGYARDTDYYQILAYTRALDVPQACSSTASATAATAHRDHRRRAQHRLDTSAPDTQRNSRGHRTTPHRTRKPDRRENRIIIPYWSK
jgi:McrBC 5-methylcytosine restriction system component